MAKSRESLDLPLPVAPMITISFSFWRLATVVEESESIRGDCGRRGREVKESEKGEEEAYGKNGWAILI